MSGRQQNGATPRISRGKSIPNNKNVVKTNQNQIQQKKSINKNSNILDKKRNIKVDYNSSNYFYNDEDYYDDYEVLSKLCSNIIKPNDSLFGYNISNEMYISLYIKTPKQ